MFWRSDTAGRYDNLYNSIFINIVTIKSSEHLAEGNNETNTHNFLFILAENNNYLI